MPESVLSIFHGFPNSHQKKLEVFILQVEESKDIRLNNFSKAT